MTKGNGGAARMFARMGLRMPQTGADAMEAMARLAGARLEPSDQERLLAAARKGKAQGMAEALRILTEKRAEKDPK